jgi:hypothetical protein
VNECRSLSRMIVRGWTWAWEGSNTPSKLHHHRGEIGYLVDYCGLGTNNKRTTVEAKRRSGWML